MPRRDITDLVAAIRSKYGVDAEIMPQGGSRHRKILLKMSDGRNETLSTSEVVRLNKAAGFKFFSNENARMFDSRLESDVYVNNQFVTSERNETIKRGYTIREYNPETHDVSTVGEFLGFKSLYMADKAIRATIDAKEAGR